MIPLGQQMSVLKGAALPKSETVHGEALKKPHVGNLHVF